MNNQWRFKGNELNYLKDVIASGEGSSTAGSYNKAFEELFAKKNEAKFAVTFNSGTSTLHAALDALDIRYDDEIIIPPLTVISNFQVCIASNSIPVFADVNKDTFNICPDDIERKITSKTKAIMPVSLYGLSADMDRIMAIAKKYKLAVIHDAAQAHGATWNNKPINFYGDITSYSTENSKHIATGDGGIITTNDEMLAKKCRKFGSLGYALMTANDGRVRLAKSSFQDPNYKRHDAFAFNYRMPEVAAAVGLAQTERYEEFINLREKIGSEFREIAICSDFLIPQKEIQGARNTYWTFAAKMINSDIPWQDFRKKYIEYGGESIFAAWALTYDEPVVADGHFKKHNPVLYKNIDYSEISCPDAEEIQPQLMQFPLNYKDLDEAQIQFKALKETLDYFK
ncbi:DegT/DnrJ/EryC1/StrS family aminotransferase [Gammaproteobacteria bacterium]|nr:DegT/DnrJ/EryC1/StrS family aminotransferase [Gammaproteobacteria bacterium]